MLWATAATLARRADAAAEIRGVAARVEGVAPRRVLWDGCGPTTLLDIANVLGRWETCDEWSTRTEFTEVENASEMTEAQGGTRKRYEMAQNLGQVERIALVQNCAKLPFRDEALAASCGLTVADMNELPVNNIAVNVVFDALAQSKSSLVTPEALNERRAAFVVDGALNEGALTAGLIKSRCLVILSWFLFGKGNFFGFLIVAKIVSDNLANMGYTDAGEGFVQQLLARSDLVLLALATGGLMTTVGQAQERGEMPDQ